jgi:hypothetical protein
MLVVLKSRHKKFYARVKNLGLDTDSCSVNLDTQRWYFYYIVLIVGLFNVQFFC